MIRHISIILVLSICLLLPSEGQEIMEPLTSVDRGTSKVVPNDPLLTEQYYLDKMEVLKAWSITTGSPALLIGVVERGFDPTHEEFQTGRIRVYQLSGMEHPQDWIHKNHGTEVVGQVAAECNNRKGIAGLATGCNVIVAEMGTHESFRKKTPESSAKWNRLIGEKAGEAIRYLVDHGCKVINCSFTTATTPAEAFEYAIDHDVVIVVASGNSSRSKPAFPAGQLDVLCVGGLDSKDNRWVNEPRKYKGRELIQGSSYGKGLNVVAPCRDLVVCMAHDKNIDAQLPRTGWIMTGLGLARRGYLLKQNKGATSNAAPMATALVALIRSLRPDLTFKEVIEIVEQGADDLGEPGWDQYTGYGRINFYRSLRIAKTWPRNK